MSETKVPLPQTYITLKDFGYPVWTLRFSCFQNLQIIWLSNILTFSVLYEGYFRNTSCTLTFIFILTKRHQNKLNINPLECIPNNYIFNITMQWNNTVCLNRGENVYCVIPGLIRYTDTVEYVESGTPRDQDNVSDCTNGIFKFHFRKLILFRGK